MDFSSVCRTCLSSSSLNPIFVADGDFNAYSNAIYIAIGVKVQHNDNLPQNMCADCENKMTDIFKFRIQCHETEAKLMNIANETLITKKQLSNDNKTSLNIKDKNPDTKPLMVLYSELKKDFKNKNVFNSIASELQQENKQDTINDEEIYGEKNILNNKTNECMENFNNYENNSDFSDEEINNKQSTKTLIKYSINNTENTEFITSVPYQVITDTKNKVSRVLCKLCNKELSIRSVDSHMSRRHPGADERKVKCELCDSYIMKDKLNRHSVLMHGSGCYKCRYCKIDFESKEELVQHVSSCTAKKKTRKTNESGRELRECDVCHKVMQKASIRMHKAVKHAGLKPVCEHCGKSFGNKFRLNEHYRAKHGYEKFQCSFCEFKSAGTMAMRNHERRHRGEKPFVCEACGAKFHAAYLLAQHKHSHKTEKLVKCDKCPSKFKANDSLHMHKLTCHSKNMYRCIICNKVYKCKQYAVKHIRHVHRFNGNTLPLTVLSKTDVKLL